MTLDLPQDGLALQWTADGDLCLEGSPVTLDAILRAHLDGHAIEEIAESHPSVSIAQIGAAIEYYLSHRADVDEYLGRQARRAVEVWPVIEDLQGMTRSNTSSTARAKPGRLGDERAVPRRW